MSQDKATRGRGPIRFADWLAIVVLCGRFGHPAAMRLERRALRRARIFAKPSVRRSAYAG